MMDIVKIDGSTRTIGEAQGYQGLPLRDVILNDAVTGPATPAMQSAWQPSPADIEAIAQGAQIILTVCGRSHPPVMIEVGPAPIPTQSELQAGFDRFVAVCLVPQPEAQLAARDAYEAYTRFVGQHRLPKAGQVEFGTMMKPLFALKRGRFFAWQSVALRVTHANAAAQ